MLMADRIPKALQMLCITLDANWGPLSDIIFSGSPKRFHTLFMKSVAVLSAEISFLQGDMTIVLEN